MEVPERPFDFCEDVKAAGGAESQIMDFKTGTHHNNVRNYDFVLCISGRCYHGSRFQGLDGSLRLIVDCA